VYVHTFVAKSSIDMFIDIIHSGSVKFMLRSYIYVFHILLTKLILPHPDIFTVGLFKSTS